MQVFDMAPIESKAMWWVIAIIVVVVVAAALVLVLSRAPRFEVSAEGLRISGNLFGRMIPAAELRVDAARIVDFAKSPELRPKWRTIGLGLPGYKAGWFRLYDGEKALVFLSDAKPAVYIPTSAGYGVLISPRDPAGLLSSLQAVTH